MHKVQWDNKLLKYAKTFAPETHADTRRHTQDTLQLITFAPSRTPRRTPCNNMGSWEEKKWNLFS